MAYRGSQARYIPSLPADLDALELDELEQLKADFNHAILEIDPIATSGEMDHSRQHAMNTLNNFQDQLHVIEGAILRKKAEA